MTNDNPYAAPASDLASAPRLRLNPTPRCYVWLVAFGLNLIVPALFASGMLDQRGWLGVGAAATLLGGGGFAILSWRPSWAGPAVKGAIFMAITQFLPVLQMIAGMVGLGLTSTLMRTRSPLAVPDNGDFLGPRCSGLLSGFLGTTFTGLSLLAISFVVGMVLEALFGKRQQPSLSPGSGTNPEPR